MPYTLLCDELEHHVKKVFKFDDGPVLVVLATLALSLGGNFKDVRYVIHDLRNQLWEAGRAGRNGQQAFNVTFYHGQQSSLFDTQIKRCIKLSTCPRVAFLQHFVNDAEPLQKDNCNCHQLCKCGEMTRW